MKQFNYYFVGEGTVTSTVATEEEEQRLLAAIPPEFIELPMQNGRLWASMAHIKALHVTEIQPQVEVIEDGAEACEPMQEAELCPC